MVSLSLGMLYIPKTPLFWFLNGVFLCFYFLSYTLHATFRCYGMFNKNLKRLAILANVILYIGYLIYYWGLFWELPTVQTTLIFLGIIQIPFFILVLLFITIRGIIKSNSVYKNDLKQKNLLNISGLACLVTLIFGFPTALFFILAGFLESGLLVSMSLLPAPYIKLVFTVTTFAIQWNKFLEAPETLSQVNSSIFKSVNR